VFCGCDSGIVQDSLRRRQVLRAKLAVGELRVTSGTVE
jgi:hypothetical protein